MIDRLQHTLEAAGIYGVTIDGGGPGVTISFLAETSQSQRTQADAILAAFNWSQAAHNVWLNELAKAEAVRLFDDLQGNGKIIRAIVLTLIDEVNVLRQWLTALKAATALSTNYSTLKSGIAGLANTPDRTVAQAKTAISNKVTSDA